MLRCEFPVRKFPSCPLTGGKCSSIYAHSICTPISLLLRIHSGVSFLAHASGLAESSLHCVHSFYVLVYGASAESLSWQFVFVENVWLLFCRLLNIVFATEWMSRLAEWPNAAQFISDQTFCLSQLNDRLYCWCISKKTFIDVYSHKSVGFLRMIDWHKLNSRMTHCLMQWTESLCDVTDNLFSIVLPFAQQGFAENAV